MTIEIDRELGETEWENEEKNTEEIVKLIRKSVLAQYQPGQRPALRDAHPKAHGCVKATFKVNDNLKPELAQGVFVPGKTYQAMIRFSNGDPDPMREDKRPDARGMAIKLLDVPGRKILPDERDALTQDFVMIDYPVFFLNDPKDYLSLQKFLTKSETTFDRVIKALILNHPRSETFIKKLVLAKYVPKQVANLIIRTTSKTRESDRRISSPLTTQYWSMSAYRLGDPPHKMAIRFSAIPKQAPPPFPDTLSRNYLRDEMKTQLETSEYQFNFAIQRKQPPNTSAKNNITNVENNMVEWPPPYESVATITIPRQKFATPARDQFCEGLSFTPWHAMPQHRPLGGVNRMRRVAYETISKLRHERNGTQRREPTEPDVP